VLDPLGEAMGMLRPIGVSEERMEVSGEPVVERDSRLTRSAPRVFAGRQRDAVGRKAIAEQRQARAFGGLEVIEHGQQDCAHVAPSYGEAGSAPGVLRLSAIVRPPFRLA
jgi:hypothetical protein